MKLKNTLLAVFCLASSAVIAQSSQPQIPIDSQVQPQPPSSGGESESMPEGQSSGGESEAMPEDQSSGGESASMAGDQSGMQNLPPPAPMTQLEPKTENGFTYMCGGVGAEEAAQVKEAARDYDMMLTFATRKGDYLADVNVDIKHARGTPELKTTCDGPLMLVDFPRSGTYQIHAETGGYTLNQTARVQAKGRSHEALVLSWPQQVATAAPEPTPSSGAAPEPTPSSGASSGVSSGDNNGSR